MKDLTRNPFFRGIYMKGLYPAFVFAVLLLAGLIAKAQTFSEIRSNPAYLWGEGNGSTLKAAEQEALASLIGRISVFVESKTEFTTSETAENKQLGFAQSFRSTVQTYSSATLNNVDKLVLGDEPDAHILLYIKRSEVDKVFEQRKTKILDFVRFGLDAEKKANISDALRYHYWALTLLRSHPGGSGMTFQSPDGNEILLWGWLNKSINEVLSNISIRVTDVQTLSSHTKYLLNILYKGKPAARFDYTYFTGRTYSNVLSTSGSRGIVELNDTERAQSLRIRAEYVFEGEASVDHELRDVLQRLDVIPFRANDFQVEVPGNAVATPAETEEKISPAMMATGTGRYMGEVTESGALKRTMEQVGNAIAKKDLELAKSHFTREGYEIFKNLMDYGNATIVAKPALQFMQYGDDVICRALPVKFSFRNNRREFVEDVVFHFNQRGKIHNITFALGPDALDDLLQKETWTPEVRWALISFLENYKTAFALKRLDYIENLFADDAVIIVGRVAKIKTNIENRYRNNEIIQYNRYNKEQYVKNLKHAFASNEFINLKLLDNDVRKSGRPGDVYGIQIRQDYFSTNYGDTGYLFLLVDLSEPDTPVIHIRTWQPQKNPDGSIYGVEHF